MMKRLKKFIIFLSQMRIWYTGRQILSQDCVSHEKRKVRLPQDIMAPQTKYVSYKPGVLWSMGAGRQKYKFTVYFSLNIFSSESFFCSLVLQLHFHFCGLLLFLRDFWTASHRLVSSYTHCLLHILLLNTRKIFIHFQWYLRPLMPG